MVSGVGQGVGRDVGCRIGIGLLHFLPPFCCIWMHEAAKFRPMGHFAWWNRSKPSVNTRDFDESKF